VRQRRLARLHPVLDPHQSRIEHTFDQDKRRIEQGAVFATAG